MYFKGNYLLLPTRDFYRTHLVAHLFARELIERVQDSSGASPKYGLSDKARHLSTSEHQ